MLKAAETEDEKQGIPNMVLMVNPPTEEGDGEAAAAAATVTEKLFSTCKKGILFTNILVSDRNVEEA